MDHTHHDTGLLAQPIPIVHLPLRRSTIELLRACGFHSVKEVYDCINARQLHGGNDGVVNDGIAGSNSGGMMNLVMEFRNHRAHIERNFRGAISARGSPLSNDATPMLAEELKFAQSVYLELVDAVTIVAQDDAIGSNISMKSRIGSSYFGSQTTTTGCTAKTAADLLRINQNVIGFSKGANNSNIITFCRALDELLDGGIAIGELTELAGSPGSGKTTMCMQLAVNAALPTYCGGVHGRTVYIDTEGSFAPERCYDLAAHLIQHVQTGLRRKYRQSINSNDATVTSRNSGTTAAASTKEPQHEWNVTAEDILSNILVYRVHDVADLSAIVQGALPALLASSWEMRHQHYKCRHVRRR
jgi:hypothetical protein